METTGHRDLRAHQGNRVTREERDNRERGVSQENQLKARQIPPEIPEPPESRDPMVPQESQDSPEEMASREAQVNGDPQDHRERPDHQETTENPGPRDPRECPEKGESVPNIAPWTEESSSKMAQGVKYSTGDEFISVFKNGHLHSHENCRLIMFNYSYYYCNNLYNTMLQLCLIRFCVLFPRTQSRCKLWY